MEKVENKPSSLTCGAWDLGAFVVMILFYCVLESGESRPIWHLDAMCAQHNSLISTHTVLIVIGILNDVRRWLGREFDEEKNVKHPNDILD